MTNISAASNVVQEQVPDENETVLITHGVSKHYGHTQALNGISLSISRGEILGLVGHNGAGKSTLMRIIAGVEQPDAGSIEPSHFPSSTIWDAASAKKFGVRMAYQELALCNDLNVFENAYLSDARNESVWAWKSKLRRRFREKLEEVFPSNGIQIESRISDLSLAQRQIVEIARAVSTSSISLLILDEPTESLGIDAADQLYAYLHRYTATGGSVLLISHRLHEILQHSDRIAVLRDGKVVEVSPASALTEADLVTQMGGTAIAEAAEEKTSRTLDAKAAEVASITGSSEDIDLKARHGEIIGLAGLAGQGQETVLRRLWDGGTFRRSVQVSRKRAYVPGDRQSSGIFPQWDVEKNLNVSLARQDTVFGIVKLKKVNRLARQWISRLQIKGGARAGITTLSGGNQQKVLVARAFATDADLILLDDPFRGVDVHTKTELYQLMKDETANGRCVIWYSTENQEMQHCDRVYILRSGHIVCELAGNDISEDRIIAESFEGEESKRQ